MLTNAVTPFFAPTDLEEPAHSAVEAQKVVIVNGTIDTLDLIERVLDAGHYDVVFVESNEHAYSQIKRVQPDLVILCVRIDDLDGFHVLSMLKLDQATREIPVVTYSTEYDSEDPDEELDEATGLQAFPVRPLASRMN